MKIHPGLANPSTLAVIEEIRNFIRAQQPVCASLTDLILNELSRNPGLLLAAEKNLALSEANKEKLNRIISLTEEATSSWLQKFCPVLQIIAGYSSRQIYSELFYGLYLRRKGKNVAEDTSRPLLVKIKAVLKLLPRNAYQLLTSNEVVDIYKLLRKLLCTNKAIHATDVNGRTLLHKICMKDESGTQVALLLAAGADMEAQTKDGIRPIHVAAQSLQAPGALTQLLAAGAEREPRDNKGRTPADLANEKTRIILQASIPSGKKSLQMQPITYTSYFDCYKVVSHYFPRRATPPKPFLSKSKFSP